MTRAYKAGRMAEILQARQPIGAPFDPRLLQVGDQLLYRPVSFKESKTGWVFGEAIALITKHPVSHVEVYVGLGRSVASRDGQGVGCYPLRTAQLLRVRRPLPPFDEAKAWAWFQTVNGQAYDWKGLLRFVTTHRIGTRADAESAQFCSEFAARYDEHAGVYAFGDLDCDATPPCQFDESPLLPWVYSAAPIV